MTCSIIIVNYNTKQLLDDLLQSIVIYLTDVTFEVIIIDNASSDESHKLFEKYNDKFKLKWIQNSANYGFARANNQGIVVARGNILLLLNSDTLLIDDSLNKIFNAFEKDTRYSIVGCQLLNSDLSIQQSCGLRPNLQTEFLNKLMIDRLLIKLGLSTGLKYSRKQLQTTREPDWVTGAFLMMKKDVISQIGLLDEQIHMFYEDIDFCVRAKNIGLKIQYNPLARILHFHGGSWKKWRAKSIVDDAESCLYFHRKHSGLLTVAIVRFLLILQNSFRLLYLFATITKTNSTEIQAKRKGYWEALKVSFKK
ncbi:MAG: glycosyltransferase family 2 protein [Calditrichaeota bacterium]|nr:MAG: glycosyltransferase family 2 protein [Calditrichota bacterium]